MAYRLEGELNLNKANLSYYCRGCKQTVRGIPLTKAVSKGIDDHYHWLLVDCPTDLCELSFVIYDSLNDRVLRVFPNADFEAKNYHESIPERIREDLAEAERCMNTNSHKAAVVMYRRVLQNIVLDKIEGASIKGKDLKDQIGELFKQGFITKYLAETAHEIRQFGNFGAHPRDDMLDSTTKEDAEVIAELTFSLLGAIYLTSFKTEKIKEKRAAAKNS